MHCPVGSKNDKRKPFRIYVHDPPSTDHPGRMTRYLPTESRLTRMGNVGYQKCVVLVVPLLRLSPVGGSALWLTKCGKMRLVLANCQQSTPMFVEYILLPGVGNI